MQAGSLTIQALPDQMPALNSAATCYLLFFFNRYCKRTAKDPAFLVENSVKQVAWLSPTSTALGTASPLAVPGLV